MEALKERLGGDLSQSNVDKFLFQNLKRKRKYNSARNERTPNNTDKENL
jgi:hypothetical protein